MVTSTKNINLLTILGHAIDSGTLNRAREILNHPSPPDMAHELETAPPKYRHVLWELIEQQNSGAVPQELSDDIQAEFLNQMNGSKVVSLTASLDVDILQQLLGQVVSEA